VSSGVASLTHTFNAMRSIGQRDPGVVEAITDTTVFCEVIADGIHVHPAMIRMLRRLAGPDRVVLVTDASEFAGRPDGDYVTPRRSVGVADGAVRLTGTQTLAGSTPASLATAICRQFGLRGGGLTVDAAGASSLTAMASACLALTAGELDVAVAGGVDLSIDPLDLVGLAKSGLLATADMRVYDEHPTGFLPGEGCGVVLLMRTADARAASLPVYAEILGWGAASNGQPGRPGTDATAHLLAMQRAHELAGVDPGDVQLIEGCGTAVPAGDQAELTALAALRAGARQVAVLGSISANIGNTGAAAGAAALIKTVLAIANGVLPPSTGVRTPHPILRDGRAALRLPASPEPWPKAC